MIRGKGRAKKKMPTKAEAAISQSIGRFRAPFRHAEQGLDDDDDHRGLDADEGRLDERKPAEISVGHTQGEHDQGARKNEEQAGGEAADRAVQAPADIGGKLHGLGARAAACRN